jgi:hypothetical protein
MTLTKGSDSAHWIDMNSTDAYLTGKIYTGVTINAGDNLITLPGVPLDCIKVWRGKPFCQMNPNQRLSDTGGCIPTHDLNGNPITPQVGFVWFGYGRFSVSDGATHTVQMVGPPTSQYPNGAPTGSCVNDTITVTDQSGGFSMSSVVPDPAHKGTGYAVDDPCTLHGGTLLGNIAAFHVAEVDSNGAVTKFATDDPGSYSVFPASPNTPDCTSQNGTGLQVDTTHFGALQLFAAQNEGAGIIVQTAGSATASVVFNTPFIINYRQNLVLGDHAVFVSVVSPQINCQNTLQDKFLVGIYMWGTNQGNKINGNVQDHCFGHEVLYSVALGAHGVPNSITGLDVGGNSLGGKNQIVLEQEGATPGTPSKSRLIFGTVGASVLQSAAFISNDTDGISISSFAGLTTQLFGQDESTAGTLAIDRSSILGTQTTIVPVAANGSPEGPCVNNGTLSPTGSFTFAFNNHSGWTIQSGAASGPLYVMLSPHPMDGACLWLSNDTVNGFVIDPNGNSISTGIISQTSKQPLVIKPAFSSSGPKLKIEWERGASRWFISEGSPSTIARNFLQTLDPVVGDAQGQSTVDTGAQIAKFCPSHGNGWLINAEQRFQLAPGCVYATAAQANGVLAMRYGYFQQVNPTASVTSITNDGGLIQVHVVLSPSFTSGDPICIYNSPSPEANGCWAAASTGTGTVDLANSTFANACASSCGTAGYQVIIMSSTGHANDNGIEIQTGHPERTFVFAAWMDASGHYNDSPSQRDFASYQNPVLKNCFLTLGSPASPAGTTLTELNSAARVHFITIGPTGAPRAFEWEYGGSAANDTSGDGFNAAISFDNGTPEARDIGSPTVAANGQVLPFGESGTKTTLTEGPHTMSLYGAKVTGGNVTFSAGSSVGCRIWN